MTEQKHFRYEGNVHLKNNPTDVEIVDVRFLTPALIVAKVDGNDVDAVYEAAKEAVERARAGKGPTLIECVTYRHKGHSKSDKNLYRTKEGIEFWKTKDPVGKFETLLIEKGILTKEQTDQITENVRNEIRNAITEASAAPDSDPAELITSVFRAVN